MSTKNNGGPVFPVTEANFHSGVASAGMSLRDYFAAKAMPAIYASAMKYAAGSGLFSEPDWRCGLALDAYKMADAMLAAREAAQ